MNGQDTDRGSRPQARRRRRRFAALARLRGWLRARRFRTVDLPAIDALTRRGESRIVFGNTIGLHLGGQEAFGEIERAISEARSTVSIEMYLWRNDRLGRRIAQSVASRARSGVQVRIIYDAFGCADDEEVFRTIVDAGGRVEAYGPLGRLLGRLWPGSRDHRKLIIVDGQRAFVSGRNIGEEYSEEFRGEAAYRDLTVSIEGPSVRDCARLFLKTWMRHGLGLSRREARRGMIRELPTPKEQGPSGVQVLGSRGFRGRRVMRDSLVQLLRLARNEALFAHAYFFPDRMTLAALCQAARRGVRVVMIFPGVSDVPLAREAGRAFYGRLLHSGIEVWERQGRMLHMKAGVVDGEVVVAGSANLDTLSLLKNEEIAVNLLDGPIAQRLSQALRDDLAASRRVTVEEWEKRGRVRRYTERIAASLRGWY